MTFRKPLLAGNWKMFKTVDESVSFANTLRTQISHNPPVDVVVAPTSIALFAVCQALQGSPIHVAAQNVHPKASGAYTGEISPAMLAAVGCRYCIIGHSERRQWFAESDTFIREKLEALLSANLSPILCIGESLEEREKDLTFPRIYAQIDAACKGLSREQISRVIIAYEPIWAIGTGRTATPQQAGEVHQALRTRISELFNADIAQQQRILYGGSVKPNNIDELMAIPDIDGALVGGASLEVDSFLRIVQFQSSSARLSS